LGGTLVQQMVAEAEHRRGIENRAVDAEIAGSNKNHAERARGQHYALVIGVVAILSGTAAACRGHDLTGSLIGGGGVVGLVTVFVQGRASGGGRTPTARGTTTSHESDRPS